MSLIKVARDLATNEYKFGCTVEHVFLAALPPLEFQSLDEPARQVLNIFSGDTLERWKLQVRAKLKDFKDPPPVGQDSQDLKEVLTLAEKYAAQDKRDSDDDRSLLLALIMRTKRIQEYIEEAHSGDLQRLLAKLNEQRISNSALGAVDGAKQKAEEDAKKSEAEIKVARETLTDLLRDFKPTEDRRYVELSAVDVTTFLHFLGEAAVQAQVYVVVGRDGTLIDEIPQVVADRLAKKDGFQGLAASLAEYTGKLCTLDLRTVLARAKQPGGAKPARVVRAAYEHILGLPEKSILMLDHVEAIKRDGKDPLIEELCETIADPGRVLVFGVFHAPSEGDQAIEADLGHKDIIRPLPMTIYDSELTKTILNQFYFPLWHKAPPRGYSFADNAFDALIELEPGAWVHRRRTALPGLVTEVTADAMMTAGRGPEQVKAVAQGALRAFKELAKNEAPSSQDRAKFERILKLAEIEVRRLVPKPKLKWLAALLRARPQPPDPGKPIKITAAHVLAEFICHNVSEFHYPGVKPRGITEI